jgi:hypothetical protein
MAQGQRTPGPIYLFAKFRNLSTAYYLGTCITAPEPENEKFKIEVMNDISGRSVPFQLVQDGEKFFILATMNRFNLDVVANIRALESGVATPNTGVNSGLGSETAYARGTLNIGVSDFQLITLNAYYGTTSAGVFVGGVSDLPAGRMYYSCNLRKYKESTVGTRVLDVSMAIECQNVYDPTTRTSSLYTENPVNFPAGVGLSYVQ